MYNLLLKIIFVNKFFLYIIYRKIHLTHEVSLQFVEISF